MPERCQGRIPRSKAIRFREGNERSDGDGDENSYDSEGTSVEALRVTTGCHRGEICPGSKDRLSESESPEYASKNV